ncbi:PEP/pyruvate-binding domain-containing protein [Cloacibacillus porcorum]|uniref:PEP/pyruvate-binding domain-containing protein n=1 Tax=Cloacibacillus porcorum TaxID=1197717 RepID=UPI0023F35EF6|nr:PEP/pyruvate-binding domain-containing protein [Cloacibacillus porcorum]MDD7648174.1 PEP/pyruvate-binding domain-containing protein [Cloacibacillus porcorum]MDY4093727.1 PEP/pyruvate-binding domain-containing protein [Cloacibacillus porcorum]
MNYGDFYRSFDPVPFYEERGWLIGDGRIGGKSKGLSFAHHILEKNGLLEDVHLPKYSFVITTSVFDEFMEYNNLWERLMNLRAHSDAPELYKICAAAHLPPSLDEPLEKILDLIEDPISVRSSSTLEDDVNLSFAGKYATRFSSNAGTRGERRAELESAIKTVYASTYNPAAREYKRKHGIQWGGERMAVLIQPIEGRRYGNMFYPELAGAAFSKVFRRPSPRIRKEDGVVRICFGLGTRTVDRAYARTFYLTNPNLRPEGTKPHEIVTHSQEHYDYVDTEHRKFTSQHIAVTIKDILKKHKMAPTYLQWFDDNAFHWIHTDPSNMNVPRPVFTFSELPGRCPKLFTRLKKLLSLFEKELQLPVDMEFAYEVSDDRFTLVQLRPLSVYDDKGRVEIPDTPREKTILRGDRMVANGRLECVRHIVFVDPEIYGKQADFADVARAVGEINDRLDGERYILVGPGRWGSSNPLLGVPVRYNELSNSGCLVELGIPQKGMAPELSYGTHFFLDLDGDNILYLPVFDGEKNNIYNREWFESHPWQTISHPAVRHYEGCFDVLLDGDSETGIVIDKTPEGK